MANNPKDDGWQRSDDWIVDFLLFGFIGSGFATICCGGFILIFAGMYAEVRALKVDPLDLGCGWCVIFFFAVWFVCGICSFTQRHE